ncbi:MAG: glycosyltransferase [Sumerlaeia bacterium]
MLSALDVTLLFAYYLLLTGLAVFGAHRLWMVWSLRRLRRAAPEVRPELSVSSWPSVTVQLPLYNEPSVARRLIDAVAALDYPADRLAIHILDDSTDVETSAACAEAARHWGARGLDVQHLRRASRAGFKAGALAWGLERDRSELIAIFDADFLPPRDFLRRLAPEFAADPRLGLVQARWGHLNRESSLLTRLQATMLDGHFRIEHAVRAATGRFFNFNGTAGIWRRAAIDDAGGWEGDTLTEDLDLSYRAQLRGWRFVYRDDVVAPAELPAAMAAYRSQQQRWAKGSMEVARKLGPRILRAHLPRPAKAEAAFHLLGNSGHLMMVLLLGLSFPVFSLRELHGLVELRWLDAALFFPATAAFFLYFLTAARLGGSRPSRAAVLGLGCMMLGVGMALNNASAVIQGLLGRRTAFVRTPKTGAVGRKSQPLGLRGRSLLPLGEAAFGCYFLLMVATAKIYWVWPATTFAGLMAAGCFFVASQGVFERGAWWLQSATSRK